MAKPTLPELLAKYEAQRAADVQPVQRFDRAAYQGFDINQKWYHGSTHDIEQMRPDLLNPESHFGKGYYLTTSPADASKNYAGMGPDLTQRIQMRAEQIANDLDVDYDDPKALEQATEELKGQSEGVIYPVITRSQKTFDISSDGDTFLDYKLPDLDPEDYLDEADGDIDLARDLAFDDSMSYEPEGDLVEFINSIANDPRMEGDDAQKLVAAIQETAIADGGIQATDLDRIMRKTEFYATDYDTGQMVNNEVYRQALESAGFDSVVHDGDIFLNVSFNKNIEPGTKHKIVFAPENIRSINAEFDPQKTNSPNLLASPAGTTIGAGLIGATAVASTNDAEASAMPAISGTGPKGKRIVGQTRTHYLTNYGSGSIPKGAVADIPTMEGVAQRAQTFASNRDRKNKAWTGLKDAVGKMTQPFQPLAEFLAHSAAGMASGAGGAVAYDTTDIPAQTIEQGREFVRGIPEQMGFGPIDQNAYQVALNQAMEGIADTVINDNAMRAFVDPVLQDVGPELLEQYQKLDPRTQGMLSGLGEYIGNAVR